VSCGVGRKRGLDPELLWLWCRLVATAPIRPLAWDPPYATGAALEKAKKDKNEKQKTPFPILLLVTIGNCCAVLKVWFVFFVNVPT